MSAESTRPDESVEVPDWDSYGTELLKGGLVAQRVLERKYHLEPEDIEDIVASAIVTVVNNLSEHDPSRSSLQSYIVRMSLLRAASHFKMTARRTNFLTSAIRKFTHHSQTTGSWDRHCSTSRVEEDELVSCDPGPADAAENEERCDMVHCAVTTLPVDLREAMELWLSPEKLTYKEIADQLGVCPKTASQRIKQALQEMEPLLEGLRPGE